MNFHEFLKQYQNKNIIYIPNPGNAGDSLIAFGTLQLFNRIGLNYTIGQTTQKYQNKILFYAGGGNLNGWGKEFAKKFILKNMNNNEIVVLPHTIHNEDELIKKINNNVKIFCREEVSYSYVHNLIKNKEHVFLSKDMAFYIKEIGKFKRRYGKGSCNCFRTDIEKTDIKIPNNNNDISSTLMKNGAFSDPQKIKEVTFSMFKYLSKFKVVNTNRLHVAIAASLLNKRVNLYPNSYYKNEAIYEFSLKKQFPKTKFIQNS